MDRTWTIVGVSGSPRVPSSGIPGEEDQVAPCEQLDALSPFNPLAKCGKRKDNPWTDPIVSTPYELRDHPKDAFGIQGSRTDHKTLFNK